MKLKKLLEGFAWERESGKPLPTLNDVAKKHNESVNEGRIRSNIVQQWRNSDIAMDDMEEFLAMLYKDGNYDTMDDMAAMFNVLSKLAKDYRKKMYYNKFD
jgi:hypothetical protein